MEFAWHSKMSSCWNPGQRIFCSSFLRACFFSAKCGIHPLPRKVTEWPLLTSSHQKRPRLAVSKSREPEPASCPGWAWVMTQYLPRDLMAWKIFLVPPSVPDGDGGTHKNVCATPEGHWRVLAHLSEAWPHLFYCLPSDTPCLSVFSLLHSFFL